MLSAAESCFMFPVKVKVHSKDELHQLDELKQTQRAHLEELLEQHWNSRGDAFLQPREGYSLAGEEPSQHEEPVLFAPHWAHNFTKLLESEHQTEKQKNVEVSDDVGVEVKRKLGGNGNVGNRDTQTASPLWEDTSKISKSHTGGLSKHVTERPEEVFSPSKETLIERVRSRFRPTKEPNPDPREQDRRSQNETPELEHVLQVEEEKLEAEKKELLLLHKRLDQEKEILRLQKIKQEEEEERLKEKEIDSQQHLHTTTPKSGKR